MIKIFDNNQNKIVYPNDRYKKTTYPDGTLKLTTPYLTYGDLRIIWLYEDDSELFELQCIVDQLKRYSSERIVLEIPYIPNARMDRTKDENEAFTLKSFATIINNMEFDRVLTYDVHSFNSELLINNLVNHCAFNKLKNSYEFPDYDLLFYPDEGARKRYSEIINRPYVFGVKNRDWKTGEIKSLDVFGGDVEHKKILIVDDICSKGGTFYHAAKKLKELGAGEINLFITHCENTIKQGELLRSDVINHIYTTNSICTVTHTDITIFNKW